MGSIPGQTTKIPRAVEQLSPSADSIGAEGLGAHVLHWLSPHSTAESLCEAARQPTGCDKILHPQLRPDTAQ